MTATFAFRRPLRGGASSFAITIARLVLICVIVVGSTARAIDYTGQVVSAADGIPIEGATITLDTNPNPGSPGVDHAGTTSPFGMFGFDSVAAGAYQVDVTRDGFLPETFSLTLTQDAIRTRSAISDSRRAGNYYRLVDEGRLLWGGAITTRVSAPARLAERMKADMLSVFPSLGNPKIDYAWAGLMGYARHFMPLIGTDGQGQWWATAFGGHGMNTTAMGGILMARAIAGGDDEYRRFAPYAPEWAGGPFGRVAVQLGYWGMQVKDMMDERRSGKAA